MHCIADILITHITTQHHISNQNMVKAYEQFQLVKVLFGETCKSYSINSDQQQLKMCNERANLVPYFVHFPTNESFCRALGAEAVAAKYCES